MYTGTHNNVCTKLRTTVYGGGRGLRGPVGVGWCACDNVNQPTLLGSAGGLYIMHSAIGPGGWGQRPRHEPA